MLLKANMSLEVAIEKNAGGFRLAVEFAADGAPLGLLGPSGSGKTMTLRAIAGLETPDRGRIVLHGRVLFDSEKGIDVPARERRIGLLFQNYALFPHLTVAENIAFGLQRLPDAERNRRIAEQLVAAHLGSLAPRLSSNQSRTRYLEPPGCAVSREDHLHSTPGFPRLRRDGTRSLSRPGRPGRSFCPGG